MGWIYFFCFALLLQGNVKAQEYNIENIPPGLRKESNVVIRKDITDFKVKNSERAVLECIKAYTIFGKDEEHYGELELSYNSTFREIDNIEGYIYNANGEEIKELEDDDIKDYSDYTDYSFYSDNRIKTASLYHNEYPYTVEFRYKMIFNGYINWPEWYSRNGINAEQLERLSVEIPEGETLRFWCSSETMKPQITEGKIYTWEVKNLPELPESFLENDLKDYADRIILAPGNFIFDDYEGSMNSWKEFGLWYEKLASTQRELPGSVRDEIKKQYNETDDVHEKIKKLYRFMQLRTRYVDIDLGITGWLPFEASFVHQKGYGDCKDLSNYMKSILSSAGISASIVLIEAGENPQFVESFSSNQFNHAIICIPLPGDTVWLECTSNIHPYNHLGDFCENRMALLINEDGGKLINTPVSSAANNRQSRKAEVVLDKIGAGKAEMSVLWTGNKRDYYYYYLVTTPGDKKDKNLVNSIKVPHINIREYNFHDEKKISDSLLLNLMAELPRYAAKSGDRLFFKPNMTESINSVPPKNDDRVSPVRFSYPFADTDTIIYKIPVGYKIETLPEEISLETYFGKYKASCDVSGNNIIYSRFYEINTYKIPAADYSIYRGFIAKIAKSDKNQVVLIKE